MAFLLCIYWYILSLLSFDIAQTIQCRNVEKLNKDWWVMFKSNKDWKYLYWDDKTNPSDPQSNNNWIPSMEDHDNPFYSTIEQIWDDKDKDKEDEFNDHMIFFAFNDQVEDKDKKSVGVCLDLKDPNDDELFYQECCRNRRNQAHSKGVFIIDLTNSQEPSAVWIIHSVPVFPKINPKKKNPNKFMFDAARDPTKAQSFLCMSLKQPADINMALKHLSTMGTRPYARRCGSESKWKQSLLKEELDKQRFCDIKLNKRIPLLKKEGEPDKQLIDSLKEFHFWHYVVPPNQQENIHTLIMKGLKQSMGWLTWLMGIKKETIIHTRVNFNFAEINTEEDNHLCSGNIESLIFRNIPDEAEDDGIIDEQDQENKEKKENEIIDDAKDKENEEKEEGLNQENEEADKNKGKKEKEEHEPKCEIDDPEESEFEETEEEKILESSCNHGKIGISVAIDNNCKKYICIGDLNRYTVKRGRGGGFACFEHPVLWKQLNSWFTKSPELQKCLEHFQDLKSNKGKRESSRSTQSADTFTSQKDIKTTTYSETDVSVGSISNE